MSIARVVYSLDAVATPLPSERDRNFALIDDQGRKFVLKIAQADEKRSQLELQDAVLAHVAQCVRASTLSVPAVHATPDGHDIVTVTQADGRPHLARLMNWLDGDLWVSVKSHSDTLMTSLGAVMADLDYALLSFVHADLPRELQWDVKRADQALKHLSLLTQEQQTIVRRSMEPWEDVDWSMLRHGVIHNDANDYNVLVDDNRVVGLLDFGDMVFSAIVCDLAVATAYAMLGSPNVIDSAVAIVRAYHARFPLMPREIDAIYALTRARLCLSLCYAAYNAEAKRGDSYQLVTAGPAWALLQHLASVPEATVQARIRRACELS